MNWLAHIFLSEQNIDFQLGNYLADPLKARVWENASLDIKRGMKVHLLIDSFTDKHEIFVQSKKRLREKGLLKSIVVDIIYDFLLTKNWDTFCNIPFEDYTNQFYKDAEYQISSLPHKPSIYVESMVRNQILNKYKTLSHVKKAFQRVDNRLSKKLLSRDNASSYYESVVENIEMLEEDFLYFFPILCKRIQKELDKDKISHWKI